MFIDRLINQGPMSMLEQSVKFTEARSDVLSEDIVNLDTPNYLQKDLSTDRFQQMLRDKADHPDETATDTNADYSADEDFTNDNVLFHDRNNRSVEKLMSDHAQNALMHNLMTELLRKQFADIQEAIKGQPT